jgi:16S rRNA (cytosine967-C5)-methyltransferase
VGRPALRRHPAGRALLGLGHRAPPPRHRLAAPPRGHPALARIQAELLDALWPLLKPGGRLLYATCSVFKAEGQAQIDAFLQRHGLSPACIFPVSPGHLLPLPDNQDATSAPAPVARADGFFYALLGKPAASGSAS